MARLSETWAKSGRCHLNLAQCMKVVVRQRLENTNTTLYSSGDCFSKAESSTLQPPGSVAVEPNAPGLKLITIFANMYSVLTQSCFHSCRYGLEQKLTPYH